MTGIFPAVVVVAAATEIVVTSADVDVVAVPGADVAGVDDAIEVEDNAVDVGAVGAVEKVVVGLMADAEVDMEAEAGVEVEVEVEDEDEDEASVMAELEEAVAAEAVVDVETTSVDVVLCVVLFRGVTTMAAALVERNGV